MTSNSLPKIIEKYQFKKQLSGGNYSSAYSLGIYRDKIGIEYFAKSYSGSRYDLAYKWLLSEASIYQQLSLLSIKGSLQLPRFQALVKGAGSLTLFTQYLYGHDLAGSSASAKANTYAEALTFLSSISNSLTLPNRTGSYWLALLPIITLYAILHNLAQWQVILRGFFYVIKNSLVLLNKRPLGLIHRDLNDKNFLVVGKQVYIIDFELAALGDHLLDLAVVLLKNNDNSVFVKELLGTKHVSNMIKSESKQKLILIYMAIYAIYDLCFANGLHTSSMRYLKMEKYSYV